MQEHEIRCCLSLLALPGAGAGAVRRLLTAAGSASAALNLPLCRLRELGLRAETVSALLALSGKPKPDTVGPADWLLSHDVAVIDVTGSHYPPLLQYIPSAPPVLFVRGCVAALASPQVAVVGSRNPTAGGRELAFQIASGLAGCGLTVTSGLAIGIDTAAHLGALDRPGVSIAVMGTGPDSIYPARNRDLAERILANGGALLTEFEPGIRPEPGNFPRRNRIISGLGMGVVVVEAALPSGSLLTAQCALEQNREVMAVPGAVRNPQSRGCHELLRHGAALIETAADVLAALGDRFKPTMAPAAAAMVPDSSSVSSLAPEERAVLDATGFEETPTGDIVMRSGLGAAVVGAALVRLELRGLLVSCAGGYARVR